MTITQRKSSRQSRGALLLSLLAVGALGLAACGGGDDEDSATRAGLSQVSQEQRIERIANKWAALFAADDLAGNGNCWPMSQPACERLNCESVSGPVPDCTPPSAAFRKSFADAKVRDVAIEDIQAIQVRAVARFSNGEAVELSAGRYKAPCYGSGCDDGAEGDRPGAWLITRFGPDTGDVAFIREVGNAWAPLFAEDNSAACEFMYGQPFCEEYFGRVGEPPEVGRPNEFQTSFANAKVERVEIKGPERGRFELQRAAAEFSNGEEVEFIHDTQGPPSFLGAWFVDDVGR
jgi:hypothetical protein